MKRKLKDFQGITLIALVITIIVLLILAGISITMITSQDGILKKATGAKDAQSKAVEEEKEKLVIRAALIDGEGTIEISKLTEDSDIVKAYTDKGYTYKGEGTFVSKDGKEAISITKSGEIEKAVIPADFTYKEGTVNTGLVIENTKAGEFVWVPVPDVIYTGTKAEETTKIKVAQGTDNKEYYTPMAKLQESSTTNYEGILYDLNKAKGNQAVMSSYGVGTTKNREPSLVTHSDKDLFALLDTITGTEYDAKYYNLAGNYSDAKAFGKDMQDEYNNMVKSVAKYGGFYVGRYETGIDKTSKKAVSKNASITDNNTTTADASKADTNKWYGLYNKQRTMAKDNGLDSIESSMIWGSQYDAMMIWMQKTGTIIGEGYDTTRRKAGETITGNSPNDIINKVYDLYGCHLDLTLESIDTFGRVTRGYFGYGDVPNGRYGSGPDVANVLNGSRLSLYIK